MVGSGNLATLAYLCDECVKVPPERFPLALRHLGDVVEAGDGLREGGLCLGVPPQGGQALPAPLEDLVVQVLGIPEGTDQLR